MAGPLHIDTLNSTRAEPAGWEEVWINAFAQHASKRFETRALVRASVQGNDPMPLAYIFALEGGGLILSIASEEDLEADTTQDTHHREQHELWSHGRGAGQNEIWISRPEQAVFYVERPEEGALSTGFGRLGLSRTPDLLVPRTVATPEKKLHHDHF